MKKKQTLTNLMRSKMRKQKLIAVLMTAAVLVFSSFNNSSAQEKRVPLAERIGHTDPAKQRLNGAHDGAG
jgi:hypothetical protein